MTIYKRINILNALTASFAATVMMVAMVWLYKTTYEDKLYHLEQLVKNHAQLINVIVKMDTTHNRQINIGDPIDASILELIAANMDHIQKDGTLDVVITKIEDEKIHFLLGLAGALPDSKPLADHLESPFVKATSGKSGAERAHDFTGTSILAAYAPIEELNLGLVTKVDLAEVRNPFIKAAIGVSLITMALVIIVRIISRMIFAPVIDQLFEAKEKAEKADRAKSNFLANMSHELRTPLNAIIGFAEVIKSSNATSEQENMKHQEYAHDIHAAGHHLLQVINDILDMAKIEAAGLQLREQEVDLERLVHDCTTMLLPQASKQNVTIRTEPSDFSQIPNVSGDPTRLKQIINNLLSNAVKFSYEGGEIIIHIFTTKSGNLTIMIEDHGIGMAEHEIPIALSKFGQIESSYTRNYEGAGLGLPLVQMLTHIHEGDFKIESWINTGTKASVTLPASRIIAKQYIS